MHETPLTPENELWDLEAEAHHKIYHKGCGGRIVWVAAMEFRCFKCSEAVGHENWDIPEETLLNEAGS